MAEFARPFRITYPAHLGRDVLHGIQFPEGVCVVHTPFYGGFRVATEFRYLGEALDMDDAVVEWADGGGA